MLKTQKPPFLRHLEFSPPVEREFQASYYQRIRSRVRVVIVLAFIVSVLQATLTAQSGGSWLIFTGVLTSLILIVLAFWRNFEQRFEVVWQPLVVLNTLVNVLVPFMATAGDGSFKELFSPNVAIPVYLLMVSTLWLRLHFRWMLLLQASLVMVSVLVIVGHPPIPWASVFIFLCGSLLVMQLPLYVTRKYERFDRAEFHTRHQLIEERDKERQKREQTEMMLHVLSQAIGGIVHDLGNPLTVVQAGAATLLEFVDDANFDREMVKEFAGIINDGAQMLNFLRLSLMEETRVLEGKPIPVVLNPTDLRPIIEAGVRYQKPMFASGRSISIVGEDRTVCVDEMKLTTVFMNLIGNAFKYSDGEVRITWRTATKVAGEDTLLIAILDRGLLGQGISQTQAQQLFVPFGRLDAHAGVEVTGLGLLSVQKIVEAHGGEVFIEGFADGTPSSFPFRSTLQNYPSMLVDDFRTALIIACPLDTPT